MDAVGVARAVVAAALLAFVPGYAWTLVLFPALSRVERVVASVALSVLAITLGVFVASAWLGVAVSATHAVWLSLLLCAGAITWRWRRSLRDRIARRFP